MAQLQAQGMPDMPPAPEPQRRNSGGLLGWLFGSGDDDLPPRPPRNRDNRDGN
jgi:hypothetical protein